MGIGLKNNSLPLLEQFLISAALDSAHYGGQLFRSQLRSSAFLQNFIDILLLTHL